MGRQPQQDQQGRLICPKCQRAQRRLLIVEQTNSVWKAGSYVGTSSLYQELCPQCQTVIYEEFHAE